MEALTIFAELPFQKYGQEGEETKRSELEMEYESVVVTMTMGADSGLESDNSDSTSVNTENTEMLSDTGSSSPSTSMPSGVPPAPPPPPLPYYLRGIPVPPPPPPIPAYLEVRSDSCIPKPPPPPLLRHQLGHIPDPPPPPPIPTSNPCPRPVFPRRPTSSVPHPRVVTPVLDYDTDTSTDWTDDDDEEEEDDYSQDLSPAEITPAQEYAECTVCLTDAWAPPSLKCCDRKVCKDCMKQMVTTNIDSGVIEMYCPHPGCDGYLSYDDVRGILKADHAYWEKYVRFCEARSESETEKVCPRCATLTVHKIPRRLFGPRELDVKVTCEKCNMEWCFQCHCPWHAGVSCRQHRNGDREFKRWIKSRNGKGDANGHHCPSCKIPIQRTTGCDHMTCSECQTHFCYSCGRRHRSFIGFGNHYEGMSVFGCPKYYNGPSGTREAARFGYVGAKLAAGMAYPPLFIAGVGVLAVCAGVILPIYGGVKLYKRIKHKKRLRRQREARREHRPQRRRDRRYLGSDLDLANGLDEFVAQEIGVLRMRDSVLGDDEFFQFEGNQQRERILVDRDMMVVV